MHVLCIKVITRHMGGCQAELPKTSENTIFSRKKTEKPENADTMPTPDRLARSRVAFELQCFRNCTLSRFSLSSVLWACACNKEH